jgi:hypothetical protein
VLSTATADISTSSSSSVQQQDAESAIADDAACDSIAEQLDVVTVANRDAAAVHSTDAAEPEPSESHDSSDGVAAAAVSDSAADSDSVADDMPASVCTAA